LPRRRDLPDGNDRIFETGEDGRIPIAQLLVLGHGAERDLDAFQSDASLNRPIEGGIP
jgi:hypothetical protein